MAFSKAAIEGRRREVAALLLARVSHTEIAARLRVDRKTVTTDVNAIRAEWRDARLTNVDDWIGEELARLAAVEQTIWPQVKEGKLFAVDRLLAIMERRAKYLGLDAEAREDAPMGPQVVVTILDGHDNSSAAPGSLAAAWRSIPALQAG